MTQSIDLTRIPEKDGVLDLPDAAPPAPAVDVAPPTSVVEPTPVENLSGLEALRADMAIALDESVTLPVSTREGYQIRVMVNVSGDEIDAWRKVSKSKRHVDGVDGIKLAALVIANKTVGIIRQGEDLVDGYGEAVHFRHKDFIDLMKREPREQLTASGAVRRFFGKDGAVDAASKAILEQSGWGDDLAPDPTAADS